MKVFISYHREDSKYCDHIIEMLKQNNITYYVVPEDANFDGWHHQNIRDVIQLQIKNCTILLCIVGTETYSRPHVDWELYYSLKGGVGKRKGMIAVMLETRDDSKNDIDYETFPPRIADNENYALIEQFASLHDRLVKSLQESQKRRDNNSYIIDNTREPMPLRNRKYYDN